MEHNSLKKFNKLTIQLSVEESAHSNANFVNILGFGQHMIDHFINDLLTMGVLFVKNLPPQIFTHTFDKIASLRQIKVILVSNL